jgi:hypothetical protein
MVKGSNAFTQIFHAQQQQRSKLAYEKKFLFPYKKPPSPN